MTTNPSAAPVCKFEEGCHRVVACEPGCGASPAGQTGLRDHTASIAITVHAPTPASASTWADTITSLVQAEHGDHMRLDIHRNPPAPADRAAVPTAVGVFATLVRQRADHIEAAHARMRDRWEVTRARIQRLHTPGENGECQHCHHSSPCPTVQVLDGPTDADLLRRLADEAQPPETETVQPVRHAPGKAILCPDCHAKGYSVCMAAEPAAEPQTTPPPVGYSGKGRVWCLNCPHPDGEDAPVGVEDVDHWERCPSCGRHVVDVARAAVAAVPSQPEETTDRD